MRKRPSPSSLFIYFPIMDHVFFIYLKLQERAGFNLLTVRTVPRLLHIENAP